MKARRRFALARSRRGRLKRYQRLMHRGQERMHRITMTGNLPPPATTWGQEVNGVTDSEWRALTALTTSTLPPGHSGAQVTAKAAIHGDPCWQAAVAPVRRYVREFWLALTGSAAAQYHWLLRPLGERRWCTAIVCFLCFG